MQNYFCLFNWQKNKEDVLVKARLMVFGIAVLLCCVIFSNGTAAENGGIKVDKNFPIKLDGAVLKFNPSEALVEIDLSKEKFVLKDVPPEVLFMVGKVYRGQFKRGTSTGTLWYFFLEQWNNGNVTFVGSQSSGTARPSKIIRITCPSFKLTDDRFAPDTPPKCTSGPNAGNGWKLFRDMKRSALVFYGDDGYELEANEVGVLPPEILGAKN